MHLPPAALCLWEAWRARRPLVDDVFERLWRLPPGDVILEGVPEKRPAAVFNPGLAGSGGRYLLLARALTGYYTYTSLAAEAWLGEDDLMHGPTRPLRLRVALTPEKPWDPWGVEDPRLYLLDGRIHATYTGRLTPGKGPGPMALPVTAVRGEDGWRRIEQYRPRVEGRLDYDKDAFYHKVGGRAYFYHRPSVEGYKYMAIDSWGREWLAGVPAGFESRVGWGAPPVEVEPGRYLAVAHGVDREGIVYRAFAVIIRYTLRGTPTVEAVSKGYILEPRTPGEVFGDRPYTVFPTAAVVLDGDLIILYGAGDQVIGAARARLGDLLGGMEWIHPCW